jgi:hypothetical protein
MICNSGYRHSNSFIKREIYIGIITFHIIEERFSITLKAFYLYEIWLQMEKSSCVLCEDEFDNDLLRFEQKLVLDSDFCAKCWDEIMTP